GRDATPRRPLRAGHRPQPTSRPDPMRTAPTLRARLASAARSLTLREAHAPARALRAPAPRPSADRPASALRTAHRRPRRCPLPTLRRQALGWAEAARAAGARFDVERKAVDAFTFSAEAGTRSLCVPSKLSGTASHQDAAAAVASRLDSRGGWALC